MHGVMNKAMVDKQLMEQPYHCFQFQFCIHGSHCQSKYIIFQGVGQKFSMLRTEIQSAAFICILYTIKQVKQKKVLKRILEKRAL